MPINGLPDFFQNFHIGTYCLQKNARTEEHIKALSECGIDFVIGIDHDVKALDLFYKYGVSVALSGLFPGWFGGNGAEAGNMHIKNPENTYINAARHFVDHPAIALIDIGDEPSSLDFPYYGKIVDMLTEHFPQKLLYLNIYPSYGMLADSGKLQAEAELGTTTYQEYLRIYCQNIDLPYISFDHYVYSSNTEVFLSDLSNVALCCKEYGKKLMIVLQVNSKEKESPLSIAQLRFQAFCALSFGASSITWACYSAGWWYNNVLDSVGNKTEQYEKLKKVNAEIRELCTEYMNYTWVENSFLDKEHICSFGDFFEISSSVCATVGLFQNNDDGAGMFYNPLNQEEEKAVIRFKYRGSKQLYCRTTTGRYELAPLPDGGYLLCREKPQPFFIFCE